VCKLTVTLEKSRVQIPSALHTRQNARGVGGTSFSPRTLEIKIAGEFHGVPIHKVSLHLFHSFIGGCGAEFYYDTQTIQCQCSDHMLFNCEPPKLAIFQADKVQCRIFSRAALLIIVNQAADGKLFSHSKTE